MRKRALNKDDKSPKSDRWRTKVRQGRLSTIRNRNITIVERIRRIPTLLTASQHISILRSWRFYNTLAVQNACSCVFFPVLILSPVLPERVARRENGLCLLSLRQNKNSSFPGHAPGKDTLRAANAAMKERFTGRKQNKRKRILLSSRHSPKRGLTGENARANAVSGRALSPVKIKFPVASADMRRHSDTLRGAQRRRKRGLRGENNRTSFLRSKVVVFPSFFFVFPS